MSKEQFRFPYILITNDPAVVAKAENISVNGVDEARGVVTFQADLDFEAVMSALNSDGGEVGLIQANNFQYKSALGDIARIFGHLSKSHSPTRP